MRALPSLAARIPAVALTGYTDPHSVQQALVAGYDAYLGKPLEPHVLAQMRRRKCGNAMVSAYVNY